MKKGRGIQVGMIFCTASFLAGTGASASTSVLYWSDHSVARDSMAGALADLNASADYAVTTASGDEDFAVRLASGDYDLGILFVQIMPKDLPDFPSPEYASIGALAEFTSNGGLGMFADWTQDNSRAAQFGFQYTGNQNQDVVTVTDPILNDPAPVESPVYLESPGWGDFSFGLSVTEGEGSTLATFGNGDAAVVRTLTGGRFMGFGMLNDTFVDYDEGVAFYTNAVSAIPEPSTYAGIFGAAGLLAALATRRLRARRR